MVSISSNTSIDGENRLAYITLTDRKIFSTMQVGDTLVDLDKKQRPVGVEVLNIDDVVPFSRISDVFKAYPEIMDAFEDALKDADFHYE